MKWTTGAQVDVEHALIATGGDVIEAAIQYAEALAVKVGVATVDTNLWLQSLASVRLSVVDDERETTG